MQPQLSIIIVHYNTFDFTQRCLRSVFEFTKDVTFEVLVIDNASRDGSTEKLMHEFPQVRFHVLDENVGFGAGNNEGMKLAQADVFLLLNSDTELKNDACSSIYQFLLSKHDTQLACCQLLNDDGSVQHSLFHGARPSFGQVIKTQWKNSPLGIIAQRIFKKKSSAAFDYMSEQEVKVCSGAGIMLKREVFETTAGFDPDFFMYCEETEWFRNRVNPKFRMMYTPTTRIFHTAKGSGSAWSHSQNRLSYFLYLYKFGKGYFKLYAFLEYWNIAAWFIARVGAFRFLAAWDEAIISWQILRTAQKEIPKYANHFGARGKNFLRFRI